MRPCVAFSGIKVKMFDSSTLVYICLHSSIDSSTLFFMSVSSLLCLFEKQGLRFTQKGLLLQLESKLLRNSSLAFLIDCTT